MSCQGGSKRFWMNRRSRNYRRTRKTSAGDCRGERRIPRLAEEHLGAARWTAARERAAAVSAPERSVHTIRCCACMPRHRQRRWQALRRGACVEAGAEEEAKFFAQPSFGVAICQPAGVLFALARKFFLLCWVNHHFD